MALGTTEQFVFDHIKANRPEREFWDGKIAQLRTGGKSDDEIIEELSQSLAVIYNADGQARGDLEGLVDAISLLTANYDSIAFALLGRDLRTEAVAAMIPAPQGWPEPYRVWHEGKQIGPFSYVEIRIKWADEELTAADQAYHEPSGKWRPLQELAEPWTAPGFVPPPASSRRTLGTKERPLPIAQDKFILALAATAAEIDNLLGKDRWELIDSSDFKDGGRVWTVRTSSDSTEEVWIRGPGLAAPKMPDGSPNILMDIITHEHVATYRKLVEDAFAKAQGAGSGDATKPEKEPESAFTSYGSVGCAVLLLVGIGVLIFASTMETRIWTVGIGLALALVFGSLSSFFDRRLKKKRAEKDAARSRSDRSL